MSCEHCSLHNDNEYINHFHLHVKACLSKSTYIMSNVLPQEKLKHFLHWVKINSSRSLIMNGLPWGNLSRTIIFKSFRVFETMKNRYLYKNNMSFNSPRSRLSSYKSCQSGKLSDHTKKLGMRGLAIITIVVIQIK